MVLVGVVLVGVEMVSGVAEHPISQMYFKYVPTPAVQVLTHPLQQFAGVDKLTKFDIHVVERDAVKHHVQVLLENPLVKYTRVTHVCVHV